MQNIKAQGSQPRVTTRGTTRGAYIHTYTLFTVTHSLYGAATTLTSDSCYFLSNLSLSLTLHNPLLFLAVNDPKEYLRWSIYLDRALPLNVPVRLARRRPRRHSHHLTGRR